MGLAWMFSVQISHAESVNQEAQAPPVIDAQILENKIKEAEASTGLEEAVRKKLIEDYRKTLTFLDNARSYEEKADAFITLQNSAPAETTRLSKENESLKKALQEKTPEVGVGASLSDLEQLVQKEKTQLAVIDASLSALNKEIALQSTRPSEARQRLIDVKRQLENIRSERKTEPTDNEPAALVQAMDWLLQTQIRMLTAETKMVESELSSHPARIKLLQLKKDNAELEHQITANRFKLLEDLLAKRRLQEAEAERQKAEEIITSLEGKHPVIRKLAEQNLNLGNEIKARAVALEQIAAKNEETRTKAKQIGDVLTSIRKKLEIAGMTQALVGILVEQRRTMPDLISLQRKTDEYETLAAQSSLREIQYDEERRKLQDVDAFVGKLTTGLPESEADAIRPELKDLVQKRIELLDKVIGSETSYLRAMAELDLTRRQLMDNVRAYRGFLENKLLWVRNTTAISFTLLGNLNKEIREFFSVQKWYTTLEIYLHYIARNLLSILLMVSAFVLIALRRYLLAAAIATGDKLRHISTDSLSHTLRALILTLLASFSIPFLLFIVGWQLSRSGEATEFTIAVSSALMRTGRDMFILLFFADICKGGGVAIRHFRWPAYVAKKLRRQLWVLMLVFLPCIFIANIIIRLEEIGIGSSFLMLIILAVISAIGIFEYRIFTPQGGVLNSYFSTHPQGVLSRFRSFWLVLFIAPTLGLFFMVLNGYVFTGAVLARNLVNTLCLIYVSVLVYSTVVRWLQLTRRRLALEAYLERRKQERTAKEHEQSEEGELPHGDEVLEVEEPEIDFEALDIKTRNLIKMCVFIAVSIGLWFIWSPVLPALSKLQEITIWEHLSAVNGENKLVPVTLADIILAFIVAVITVVAARGLPAFIEILLLHNTSFKEGDRLTAKTLLRYAIVLIGTVVFLALMGVSWSQIQWLVAALGVGVGFGLQEIVANFICGLIILFERPIRVGDIVTIGDTNGIVSRIRIRATTITTWDRQELLVPNKEFITNRLLNWSLSDPVTRITIPVGVAYGSDVKKAIFLMKEAAEEHANVLKDPAPILTFEAFGDNSLNLKLRAYLPSIDNRLSTITELHEAINQKFREAGITIAFPQRDVHFDASKPLSVQINQEEIKKITD
jgi:potassium efflux system protein